MNQTLKVSQIETRGGTQQRARVSRLVVLEYAQAMKNGAAFPALLVFFDGERYWLVDGFHRLEAARENGKRKIECEVRPGTQREAVLASIAVNSTHGLRRHANDKLRAVQTLLHDPEWSAWSDNEIARRCGVSPTFVGKVRKTLTIHVDSENERKYVTKHGTEATMNMANIGGAKPAEGITESNESYKPNGVVLDDDGRFVWSARLGTPEAVTEAGQAYLQHTIKIDLDPGYASAWKQRMAEALQAVGQQPDNLFRGWCNSCDAEWEWHQPLDETEPNDKDKLLCEKCGEDYYIFVQNETTRRRWACDDLALLDEFNEVEEVSHFKHMNDLE